MDARSAAGLLRFLEEHGFEVYVDGGWAVDALLGEQTRPHDERGFREQFRDDTRECNFVLADEEGCRLDVHSYALDAAGNNIYGVAYVSEHLTGRGSIGGYPVRCIDPEWLVKFHTGYPLDENDYHDVRLLCERYGIAMPEEYRRFGK